MICFYSRTIFILHGHINHNNHKMWYRVETSTSNLVLVTMRWWATMMNNMVFLFLGPAERINEVPTGCAVVIK